MNTRLPKTLHTAVEVQAARDDSSLQKLSHGAYRLYLYIRENEDWKDIPAVQKKKEIEKKTMSLRCLLAARNDLAKQGMDVSWLDVGVQKTEEFLLKKMELPA